MEDDSQPTSLFKLRLRADIRRELIQQPPTTIVQIHQAAIYVEGYLKYSIPRNIKFMVMEFTPRDTSTLKAELD